MRFSQHLCLVGGALPLSLASPVLVGPRSVDVCHAVVVVVDLLKLNNATPFCSSFLGIKTSTSTVQSTQAPSTTTVTVQAPESTVTSVVTL